MKQKEYASRIGIGREYLNALINGRKNPSAKLAVRLQDVTGVAREVWIFGSPEERRAAWRKARDEAKA